MKKYDDSISKGGGFEQPHTHTYEDIVIAPTCTEQGYTLHKCDCGYEYKDNFVKPRHSFGEWEDANPPTCSTYGTQERVCSGCGKVEVKETIKLSHEWSAWVEKTRPSCTEGGVEERKCFLCGAVESRKTKQLGHAFTPWETNGNIKSRYCKNCGITETVDLEKERKEKERKEREERAIRELVRKERLKKEKIRFSFAVILAIIGAIISGGAVGSFFAKAFSGVGLWEVSPFNWYNLLTFLLGALMLGSSVLLVSDFIYFRAIDEDKIKSTLCAISAVISGITIFCGSWWITISLIANTPVLINGILLTFLGISQWIYSALIHNDGEFRISACVVAIIFGSLITVVSALLIATSAYSLIACALGVILTLTGLLVDRFAEDRVVGCIISIIFGAILTLFGVYYVGHIGVIAHGWSNAMIGAIGLGVYGIILMTVAKSINDYEDSVEVCCWITLIVLGIILSLGGALYALLMESVYLAGVIVALAGVGLLAIGIFSSDCLDGNTFVAVLAVALGGLMAAASIFIDTSSIWFNIGVFVIGAIQFISGTCTMEETCCDEDIVGIAAGIVFFATIAMLIVKLFMSCSA